MREMIERLLTAVDAGRSVGYCRLVETRGSTPQKAGATMLVFADGSQFGTLGGGCVEAEVKRKTLAVLAGGVAEVAKFQLDSDYGWDDGLICGGRMQVLIDPLTQPSSISYFRHLVQLYSSRGGGCEAIAFEPSVAGGQSPVNYLFDHCGQLLCSTQFANDARAVAAIGQSLPDLSIRPAPSAAHGVAYLPILPRCRLVIVGGGHVGQAVGKLAAELDFEVWVVDDRAEYVSAERFPHATRRIADAIDRALPELPIDGSTFCLIVTRGHNHDEKALFHLIDRGAAYVGMIGSRRKIRLIFDDLLSAGVSPLALSQVHAPVGIDIGSQTVMEISVSIAAELVSFRNRQGLVPGRPEGVHVASET